MSSPAATADLAADAAPKKGSKLPLILGLVLALALGGGGFFAVSKGLILGHEEAAAPALPEVAALPDIAFVEIPSIIVSLGEGAGSRHLRFSAQLEVPKPFEPDVTLLMPRILDVLNGYLRAVDVSLLEDRTALARLRAQMLRRVQIVAGEGRIRDFLVTEFVLN